MAIIPDGLPRIPIKGFRGPDNRTEPKDPWGIEALNVEYEMGEVTTRRGFYAWQVATIGGVKRVEHFMLNGTSYILICGSFSPDTNGLVLATMGSAIPTTSLFTFGTDWPNACPWFNRVYLNGFTVSGQGGDTLDYPKYLFIPNSAVYNALRPPMKTSELGISSSVGASGNMTIGVHLAMVVLESRSGFLTRMSPVAASGSNLFTNWVLQPTGFTIATTGQKVTVTLTPVSNWADDLMNAHLVVTTAQNQSRYFRAPIPYATVPVGTTTPIVFELTDSDAIIAQQEDWTDLNIRLTKNPYSGAWPFAVRSIRPLGNRLAWVVSGFDTATTTYSSLVSERGPGVFISDSGDLEVVTEQYHFKPLMGGRDVITVAGLDQAVYAFGPDWTHITTDTGGYPVTWPDFKQIATIGTPHPDGVLFNPRGYGLVAHESGLYVLRGALYDERPLSWITSEDWAKISWPTGSGISPFHITEDAEDRKIFVQCITSEYPNGVIYVFDYSEGLTWKKVKFTKWIPPVTVGGIVIAHNYGDAHDAAVRQQLILFPYSTGQVGQRRSKNGASEFLDFAANIPSAYETAILSEADGYVNQAVGLTIHGEGIGSLITRVYNRNRGSSDLLRNTALVVDPNRWYERLVNLRSEGFSIRFQNSTAAGDWFRLRSSTDDPMNFYYRPWTRRKRN